MVHHNWYLPPETQTLEVRLGNQPGVIPNPKTHCAIQDTLAGHTFHSDHVPVAWPCLISSAVRSMSTYKDQTTQVMAITWKVTEHMIFLRSLDVICSFSHWKDSTQMWGSGSRASGATTGWELCWWQHQLPSPLPLAQARWISPDTESFPLNHVASTRYQALVFCRQPTFYAMKRSWDRDELWITTSNPIPLAAYSYKQAFTGLIKRFYGFGPDEKSILGQDPGGTFLFPWPADWRAWGEEGGRMTPQHTSRWVALWREGDGGRRSLFGPLLLWQQHREIDAKSSWYKQSVPVPSPLGAH